MLSTECLMIEVPDSHHLAIAGRLRDLRVALGKTKSTMARLAGISVQAWHNYEKGIRRISLDEAFKLRSATRVTLDYIYFGERALLPGDLAEKLGREPRGQGPQSRRPKSKTS